MRNARRYDDRIAIGLVPSSEDLGELRELGYKTLIDLRDENEKLGGYVERRAHEMGLEYVAIPIARHAMNLAEVKRFYEEVYLQEGAPVYVFSRFGRKPAVLLLLFDNVAHRGALVQIYRKAERMGFRLQGDIPFQRYLLSLINSGDFLKIVHGVREARPELLAADLGAGEDGTEGEAEAGEFVSITDALLEATNDWVESRDAVALKDTLHGIVHALNGVHPA